MVFMNPQIQKLSISPHAKNLQLEENFILISFHRKLIAVQCIYANVHDTPRNPGMNGDTLYKKCHRFLPNYGIASCGASMSGRL